MIELSKKEDLYKGVDEDFEDDIYQHALSQLEELNQDFTVVQVGSFDGKTKDELYPFLYRNKHWGGILIEPMHYPFADLKKNYDERENLIFINKAIDNWIGMSQVWTIPYETEEEWGLPPWASGCTTLRRWKNPLFGVNCTEEQWMALKKHTSIGLVETTILPVLFEEHNIEKIDIFHVDAEGADWDVIRQLNFDIYSPEIVYFEIFNLDEYEYGEAVYMLESWGYDLLRYRNNITAIKSDGLIDAEKIKEDINKKYEKSDKYIIE